MEHVKAMLERKYPALRIFSDEKIKEFAALYAIRHIPESRQNMANFLDEIIKAEA